MKLGLREYIIRPVSGGGGMLPLVQLQVRMFGSSIGTEELSPDQAREFALQLQNAANKAEGK